MPANLTPEYLNAEEQYKKAKTDEERLQSLEMMLATIPKHKGTEKMQADIKSRISKLRKGQGKKGGKHTFSYHVEKQGAAQVIVIGPPNTGKTSLINKVTNARLTVGDYPFTTRIMQPAMMPFENIQIQLVDTPAIAPDYYERWVFGLIRNADMALLIIDASNPDLLDNIDSVSSILESGKIRMEKECARAESFSSYHLIKTLLVPNKMEMPDSADNLEIVREFYGDKFNIFPVSSATGEGLEALKKGIFNHLSIVRVYTKPHGKTPDLNHPFILPAGKTVEDLAYHIHKELARDMKFARIWGKGYYDGQPVDRRHPLNDGDIIEIHT